MASQTQITDLKCEGFSCPLGLSETRPRLSWRLETTREGARQVAYRVRASSSQAGFDVPELWDSGRVESQQTAFIDYGGAPLYSRERIYWQVEVEDETGASVTSKPSWFETGLFDKSDWQAQLISAPIAGGAFTSPPVPKLTRSFSVDKPVKSARVYASAIGVYRLELNGTRVGNDELAPGWTDYRKSLRFQTYDVSKQLKTGDNELGALLGDGWAAGHVGWTARGLYSERPALLCQLEIEYEDGTREVVASDESWRAFIGPLLGSDMLMGESVNALLPWQEIGAALAKTLPENLQLRASLSPPMRVTQELPAQSVHSNGGWNHLGDGWVFDVGQNMIGRVRLNFDSLPQPLKPGTTFRLRFAECLEGGPNDTTGKIYTTNLRTAKQTDVYTYDGKAASWEPDFTFHGFRFLEMTGQPHEDIGGWPKGEAPPLSFVTGVVLGTDMERTGDFECSDALVNQLQKNIDWGWRGNSLDIPTDCPQRDERLGWTGDAQVFCETALWNRDARGFWAEWARQIRDAQVSTGGVPCVVPNMMVIGAKKLDEEGNDTGELESADGGPAWADAAVIVPWTFYRATGDVRVLSENYDMMTRFVAFLERTSKDGLRCYEGCDYFQGFGDWLAIDGSGNTEGGTPKELIGTAFFAHSANLLSQIARVLGKTSDAEKYAALFERAKNAFFHRFVTSDGRLSPPFQTPYLLALEFDLVPDSLRPKLALELVQEIKNRGGKLSTGFVGSPYINGVLTVSGHLDSAYGLLHQKAWPSWLYAVTQGATTIWERWDGWTHDRGFQDAGMNSFNHYAYGAVGAWLYSQVAGISLDPETPGYSRFTLAPKPGGELTFARAHLDTLHGRIESEWHLSGKSFKYRFVVPPNTSALATLPDGSTMELVAGVKEGTVELG